MQVRARCVSRALQLQSSSSLPAGVEQRIANLYAPDLSNCWGVEVVQVIISALLCFALDIALLPSQASL